MAVIKPQVHRFSQPYKGLALVAEGGGQRGAFTAGVLDSWLVARFNPFEFLYGTSAGAQNIASFLSQQLGYAYSLISNLTTSRQFYNPWRAVIGDNVLNLDWYFKMAEQRLYQFDEARATDNAELRQVRFLASDAQQLTTESIDPLAQGWLEALRYSSAIPYLYRSKSWVDGGVTAPVPVVEANQAGANRLVVIRTSNQSKSKSTKRLEPLKPLLCRAGTCPDFIRLMEQHQAAYHQAESFMEAPPHGVEIIEIKPQQPLLSKALGSSKADILKDCKQGFRLGADFLRSEALEPFITKGIKGATRFH